MDGWVDGWMDGWIVPHRLYQNSDVIYE